MLLLQVESWDDQMESGTFPGRIWFVFHVIVVSLLCLLGGECLLILVKNLDKVFTDGFVCCLVIWGKDVL